MNDSPPPRSHRLPSVFYNGITLAGAGLAAVSLLLIFFLLAIEALSDEHSPYMGIVAVVILPAFLVVGLSASAAGATPPPPPPMRISMVRRQWSLPSSWA